MKQTTLSLIALSLMALPASAQKRGQVVDAKGQPVAYANVVALNPQDSAVVAATLTHDDGQWQFADSLKTIQLLRVSAVGYEPLYYKSTVPMERLTLTLKSLDAHQLGEANVVARRPVSKLENGALVTSVENTVLSKAGTAEDLLQQVPGLMKSTDKDGGIEVVGRGKPLIYINGRLMRDESELKQLRSNEIKNVEVINTPGAQYDASVNAVVRIRTTRRKGEGIGVNFSNDYYQGQFASEDARLKLSMRKNAFDFNVQGGYDYNHGYWNSGSDQTVQTPEGLWSMPFYDKNSWKMHRADGVAEFNFTPSEKHSTGVRYSLKKTFPNDADATVQSHIRKNGEDFDKLTNSLVISEDNDLTHALNAYYDGRWGKGEFRIDADFFASGSHSLTTYDEHSQTQDSRQFPTESDTRNRIFSAKAQYEFPWLKGKFAVGSQYVQTNRHDNYYVSAELPGITPSASKLLERTAAGFVQYSTLLARRYQLTAGLRYERLQLDYYLSRQRVGEQSPTYSNLFPSISLAGMVGKAQLMLSYTSKTTRPDYSQLSSNVVYGNRYLLQSGNPNLKPTILHSVNVTAVWKWLQATLNYDYSRDGILFWGVSLPEQPEVTKITYINKNYSQLQATLTLSQQIKFWRPMLTAYVSKNFCDLRLSDGSRLTMNPLLVLYTSQSFTLPKGFGLTAGYRMSTRGSYQNVQILRMNHSLEAYLTKSFFKDALNINIGGRDLLKQNNSRIRMNLQNGSLVQTGLGDTRVFYIKLNYKFNSMRNRYKGESSMEDVIQRL